MDDDTVVTRWTTRRMLSAVTGGIVLGAIGISSLVVSGAVHGSLGGGLVGSLSTAAGIAVGSWVPWGRPGSERPKEGAPPARTLAA